MMLPNQLNGESIASLRREVTSVHSEASRMAEHPQLAPFVGALQNMLTWLLDLLGMPVGVETEGILLHWIEATGHYYHAILEEAPELARRLYDLAQKIEEGIEAGWWRYRTDLPNWASHVDPAEGHSVRSFSDFLTLMEGLKAED